MIVRATYTRQLERADGALSEAPVELEAEAFQVPGDGFLSEVLLLWSDDTLDRLARLGMDAEELAGCTEAAEEAFWSHEREACRVASVRQRVVSAVEDQL